MQSSEFGEVGRELKRHKKVVMKFLSLSNRLRLTQHLEYKPVHVHFNAAGRKQRYSKKANVFSKPENMPYSETAGC